MKYIVCLALMFSVALNSTAQNWRPLTSFEKFNYLDAQNNYVTFWADSVSVSGSDTTLFLNKILKKVKNGGSPSYYLGSYLENQSQHFLSNMTFEPGGNVYFRENDSVHYLLKTTAGLSDTWLFDSLNNITATVAQCGTQAVFNTPDSIKVIALSSNDTIILSKNFGILSFPVFDSINQYITLAGIEGRDSGVVIPDFYDIFSVDTGVVLYYRNYYSSHSVSENEYQKVKINYCIVSPDSVQWNVDYWSAKFIHGNYGAGDDTVYTSGQNVFRTYQKSKFAFGNFYGGQIWGNNVAGQHYKPVTVTTFPAFDHVIIKSVPYNQFCMAWDSDTILFSTKPYECSDISQSYILAEGLGMIDDAFMQYNYNPYSTYRGTELIGFIRDSIAFGTIKPDSLFTDPNSIPPDTNVVPLNFSIYPVPASDYLDVESTVATDGFVLTMYDVMGRPVESKNLNNLTTRIYSNMLESGIYFIHITNGDYSQKFTIMVQ